MTSSKRETRQYTGTRICILAAKDLRSNTRVARQALTLARAGWSVTVAALEVPLLPEHEEIETIRITVPHPLQALETRLTGNPRGRPATPEPKPTQVNVHQPAPVVASGLSTVAAVARRLVLPWAEFIERVRFARGAMRQLGGRCFDVVQAHDAPALRAASLVARRTEGKLVYDGVELVDGRSGPSTGVVARRARVLESACEARLVRGAALVVTIGDGLCDWMQHRYRIDAPLVLRNCRNFEPRRVDHRLREALRLDEGSRLVLYLSSVAPGRGLEDSLAALATLPPEIHLVVLGDPGRDLAYRQAVLAHARSLGVGQRLHFLPAVPANEVVAWASGADVGLIPFRGDTPNTYFALPNRLFEMIMARVPVAASALPDMQSLIERYGVGVTFPAGSSEAIASAIRALLNPEKRAVIAGALDEAAEDLCWETESRRYIAALEALMDPAPITL